MRGSTLDAALKGSIPTNSGWMLPQRCRLWPSIHPQLDWIQVGASSRITLLMIQLVPCATYVTRSAGGGGWLMIQIESGVSLNAGGQLADPARPFDRCFSCRMSRIAESCWWTVDGRHLDHPFKRELWQRVSLIHRDVRAHLVRR